MLQYFPLVLLQPSLGYNAKRNRSLLKYNLFFKIIECFNVCPTVGQHLLVHLSMTIQSVIFPVRVLKYNKYHFFCGNCLNFFETGDS